MIDAAAEAVVWLILLSCIDQACWPRRRPGPFQNANPGSRAMIDMLKDLPIFNPEWTFDGVRSAPCASPVRSARRVSSRWRFIDAPVADGGSGRRTVRRAPPGPAAPRATRRRDPRHRDCARAHVRPGALAV